MRLLATSRALVSESDSGPQTAVQAIDPLARLLRQPRVGRSPTVRPDEDVRSTAREDDDLGKSLPLAFARSLAVRDRPSFAKLSQP